MQENYWDSMQMHTARIRLYVDRLIPPLLMLFYASLCLSKAVDGICLGALVVCSLFNYGRLWHFFCRCKPLIVAMACYTLVVFLSDVRYDAAVAVISSVKTGYTLFTVLVVAWLLDEYDCREKCIAALSASFVILAVIILAEKISYCSLRPSLMGNAVGAAYKISFSIVTGLYLLGMVPRLQRFKIILLFVSAGAILVLETRAAWAASLIVLILYCLQADRSKKWRWGALAAIAAGMGAFATFSTTVKARLLFIFSDLQMMSDGIYANTSIGQRLYMWKKSWEMFADNMLLGIGYSRWVAVFNEMVAAEVPPVSFPHRSQPHNFIVDIASTTGILGIATFVVMLLVPLYLLKRDCNRTIPGLTFAPSKIYFALLVLFVILGCSDSITRMYSPFKLFLMILALLLSCGVRENGSGRVRRSPEIDR